MPLNKAIQKVLVIGSGPIVIGQAAEFDYAGVQACRALKEEGIETVLINSNPATIMTDSIMADRIYLEPLTLTTVERIIEKEKPDSILSGLGGQTGLTLSMELAKSGFLEKNHVRLIGSSPDAIDKAEDRLLFKETMESIGQNVVPSEVVTTVPDALKFADKIGYPVIVRPAFTLGGTGGGIAHDEDELSEIARGGIQASPIGQILVERSVAGWKEIEFEVMRDSIDNVITICSMENFDPVGVHTGDSIVIAPTVTLSDKEYQMLRDASLSIIRALGVEGGCNCQFALNPETFEYAVIEVNPRVSRSSALASKATGYPIARISTKIALGYTLDEIRNEVTKTTYSAFEPSLDYVAVKLPRWPFDKFVTADRKLGTQMKATGEVMSISDNFEGALIKGVRGAGITMQTLHLEAAEQMSDEELAQALAEPTDLRLFYLFEVLRRGASVHAIHELTMIDEWFLEKLLHLVNYEKQIARYKDEKSDEPAVLTMDEYVQGKRYGYTDKSLEELSGAKIPASLSPTYKMVDTCSGEFEAVTPYFYATYNTEESGAENEVLPILERERSLPENEKKDTVIVLGSGPIRIGQGIEFDYACVHCVLSLRELGYRVVLVNNNPETVSTDFDTADRLYFEPVEFEDVCHIVEVEKPVGVVVAFGGQTSIRLTRKLAEAGIPILGTSADGIDMAEDRERFDELLEKEHICRAQGITVMTKEEALDGVHKLTYPVLLRPSYVLGGQNMRIATCDAEVEEYMDLILRQEIQNPVLIDKYVEGREIEVDAIYDGNDVLLPGIMQHVERTGIHSGDSIAIYPAPDIDDRMADKIARTTEKLCRGLNAIGIVNLQYIIAPDDLYVIEVNPRASRTVPYLSKVTGIPIVDLAVRVSLGQKLRDLGWGVGIHRSPVYTAVKVPVFSFEKLAGVEPQLGPEMKSTGEVLGIGRDLKEALYKGLTAAGFQMKRSGGVFLTVQKRDQHEVTEVAKKFLKAGFRIYATDGTAGTLHKAGIHAEVVRKIGDVEDEWFEENSLSLIESGKVQYILSTSLEGTKQAKESMQIRRRALALGIPTLTAIDTANALADSLLSNFSETTTELVDINHRRGDRKRLNFVKMQTCGNDFIYLDCFEQIVESPESLSVELCDRNRSIGADGVVLIEPSTKADCRMREFNRDGSEGLMAANAMRCVARYLYDMKGINARTFLTIETSGKVHRVDVITREGKAVLARVDMGKAEFRPEKIPVRLTGDSVLSRSVRIAGDYHDISCISMGNPHCVLFGEEPDGINLSKIGPLFEYDAIFPERVNTEFVKVVDRRTIKMRVWERGSGETLACGSGACAAAVAAVENGYCDRGVTIRVMAAGGDLYVDYADDRTVYLTGSAEFAYSGTVEI